MEAIFATWITLVVSLVAIGIMIDMVLDYSLSNRPTEGSIEDVT